MSKPPSKAPAPEAARVVIKDTSCVIDLWKGGVLDATLTLPYRFVIALPVKESEMLDLKAADWRRLTAAGLQIVDVDEAGVTEAFALRGRFRNLSAEDCFSLVLARAHQGSILLTGDSQLRNVSHDHFGIEVHGVLWIADQLKTHNCATDSELAACLQSWQDDPTCSVPSSLIVQRLRRLKGE